ncbi:N-acetylglucosamine kinase [Sphingomonas morindae]|uniref:N-acetylglucosamine kinase n=1 Tax=Sphingomonas morindae TaxID=1541170 RepID=A0ABY4XDK3_9SPHN|nr:BadF/BadG/BcrA/BcrD ATPase family protein [Sphingomonas morindae]USI75061.1 N-acetylglucosamine kinase [Sphingomonas morindae]
MFLGVDGGGTKTAFVCMDEGGAVLARAVTGTSYHLQIGLDEAVARLKTGVEAICAQLGRSADAFDFAFFGLPAYGEDAVIDPLLAAACGQLLGHDRYRCDNDMVCGWAGSLACGDGLNLVAGTGSIGYGQRRGRAARVGGWGELFGDEGSAYWIAVQGLNAVSRMSDGRLRPGPLRRVVHEALGVEADLDLCARVMGPSGLGRDGIAALAPLVSQAAAAGDSVAGAILADAGAELARIAHALRHALGFPDSEPAPISWSGGVLAHQPAVREALTAALARDGRYRVTPPRHGADIGAALYAAHLAGRVIAVAD